MGFSCIENLGIGEMGQQRGIMELFFGERDWLFTFMIVSIRMMMARTFPFREGQSNERVCNRKSTD